MDWFWTIFNLLCGVAGLAGLGLAIRAELTASSAKEELRRVVVRNRRVLLGHEISKATEYGKLSLASTEMSIRQLYLDHLQETVAMVVESRELDLAQKRTLQRMAAKLSRIDDPTSDAEASIRDALRHLSMLRRQLVDRVTEP